MAGGSTLALSTLPPYTYTCHVKKLRLVLGKSRIKGPDDETGCWPGSGPPGHKRPFASPLCWRGASTACLSGSNLRHLSWKLGIGGSTTGIEESFLYLPPCFISVDANTHKHLARISNYG